VGGASDHGGLGGIDCADAVSGSGLGVSGDGEGKDQGYGKGQAGVRQIHRILFIFFFPVAGIDSGYSSEDVSPKGRHVKFC
jgi:hypothetical protein